MQKEAIDISFKCFLVSSDKSLTLVNNIFGSNSLAFS